MEWSVTREAGEEGERQTGVCHASLSSYHVDNVGMKSWEYGYM